MLVPSHLQETLAMVFSPTKPTPVEKSLGKEKMGLVSRNLLFLYLLGLHQDPGERRDP